MTPTFTKEILSESALSGVEGKNLDSYLQKEKNSFGLGFKKACNMKILF